MSQQFQLGDRVRHGTRPEWGEGIVKVVTTVIQDGKRCQKLTIQFQTHGRATVNTAFAPVVLADEPIDLPSDLSQLPESVTDILTGSLSQFTALLDCFRFTQDERGLMDWAINQSKLPDPLQHYDRHRLESDYLKFIKQRDLKLVELITKLHKAGQRKQMQQLLQGIRPSTRQAIAEVLRK